MCIHLFINWETFLHVHIALVCVLLAVCLSLSVGHALVITVVFFCFFSAEEAVYVKIMKFFDA